MSSVSFAEESVGENRVELIAFPQSSPEIGNLYFSDDGELRYLHQYPGSESVVYQYIDGDWVLRRRELQTPLPGMTPKGLSYDGEVAVFSDVYRTEIVEGQSSITMPGIWTYSSEHNGHTHIEHAFGRVVGGNVSRDGRVVTLQGRENGRNEGDSLVWIDGQDLINVSEGLPREDVSYSTGVPNEDGSVIVFGANLRYRSPGVSQIWVWEDGQRIEIPLLDPSVQEGGQLVAISADGTMVFGNEFGMARGGLSYADEPLVKAEPWTRPTNTPETAWVWSEQTGTVPIHDPSRFLETTIRDVSADGSVALMDTRGIGQRNMKRTLWYGEDNFVIVDDLLHSLGVSITADWYGFFSMSDDGTKLMGLASIEGSYYAILVTIPEFLP